MEQKEAKKTRSKLSQEEVIELTDLVVGIAKAVIQTMLLGIENQQAKKFVQTSYSLIKNSLEKRGKVTFYIHEGKFKFGEFPLAERNPIVNRLVGIFTKEKLISIRFTKGFSDSSFISLLNIFAQKSEEITKGGGVEKLVEKENIPGIKINPITYKLLEEDEEIGYEKVKKKDLISPIPGELVGEGYSDKKEDGESRFTDEDLTTGRKKPKIVIVDNDVRGLTSMGKVLIGEGYAVATTRNGKIALELLRGIEVDLVICIHNSRINGIEILENISMNFPNVVKILMLDEADLSIAVKAINSVSLYKLVMKPWDNEEMKRIVRIAVTQRKLIISDELLSQEIKRREITLRKDREELTHFQA